jgi:hypothetical protein
MLQVNLPSNSCLENALCSLSSVLAGVQRLRTLAASAPDILLSTVTVCSASTHLDLLYLLLRDLQLRQVRLRKVPAPRAHKQEGQVRGVLGHCFGPGHTHLHQAMIVLAQS